MKSFKIESQLHSDHLPLELNLEIEEKDEAYQNQLLPKIKWIPSKKEVYNEQINTEIAEWVEDGSYGNKKLIDIVSLVSKVGNSNMGNQNKKKMSYREKWFDIDCERARKLSFRLLNSLRKNPGSEVLRKIYREQISVYNNLCKKKKQMFFITVARDLKKVKSSKQWWEWAKHFKPTATNTIGNINILEFGNHFNKLLNETLPNVSRYAALSETRDDILDVPFTIEELEEALHYIKDKKAPGEDRLPLEFFKYGSAESCFRH